MILDADRCPKHCHCDVLSFIAVNLVIRPRITKTRARVRIVCRSNLPAFQQEPYLCFSIPSYMH